MTDKAVAVVRARLSGAEGVNFELQLGNSKRPPHPCAHNDELCINIRPFEAQSLNFKLVIAFRACCFDRCFSRLINLLIKVL